MTVSQPGPSSNSGIVVGGSYTFVPAGLDLEEHLWDSGFFAAPGDTVVVKQHRPGSGSALLCRPDGTPCGTCLVASLVTLSDAAAADARAVEQSRVRRAEEAERRRADATRHDLLDLYRAEVAARRTATKDPAERHVKALRHRDALAKALGVTPTRTPDERASPSPGGPRSARDRFADDPMARFLDRVLERHRAARSPFEGLIEAPAPVHGLWERHADGLRYDADAYRGSLHLLLLDALADRYGVPADMTATGAQVRERMESDEAE